MIDLEDEFLTTVNTFYDKIKQVILDSAWDDLNVLLKQRQDFLGDFFVKADGLSLPDQVIQAIKRIQSDDLLSTQTLKDKKRVLEKQYLSLKQGRNSIKAYKQ